MDAAGEMALQRKVVTNKLKTARLINEASKNEKKIDEFESAFKTIRVKTGVSDINEVVEKFMGKPTCLPTPFFESRCDDTVHVSMKRQFHGL